MKQEKIKVIILDTLKGKHSFETIDNNLQSFYKLLNCDTIEVVVRKINGKYYDIILDEEFLLKVDNGEDLKPCIAVFNNPFVMSELYFGNAIICTHNDDGDLEGLSDSEALQILYSTTTIYDDIGNQFNCIKATY